MVDWGECLFDYKMLKSLFLEMYSAGAKGQDEKLGNVGEHLQKFHCLKNIWISFNWVYGYSLLENMNLFSFNQMTSNAFRKLFKGISKHSLLENLRLDFPR